jgi:ABC-type lipoprotein release transport system permease subunit
VGATIVGAVLAVAVATTALTFSASLAHLFSTPRLYGEIGDYRIVYFGAPDREQLAASARSDPLIGDAAFGAAAGRVWLNHDETWRLVGVRAMDNLKGQLDTVVMDGRAPQRDDEILLGPKTFDALGVELGDIVRVGLAQEETTHMRVVGRGAVELGPTIELGEAAAMTFAPYKRMVGSDLDGCCHAFEVRFAPGASESAKLARLQDPVASPARGLPKTVADFGGVDGMPLVLSALIVAIAAGALAHTLAMAIRRRRRELAILKTLGFDRRQLVATVAWQATTFAAIGLLVGLPLGMATGRWTWNLFADELGVVPEPVTPIALVVLVVPAALLLANVVAAAPARVAARTRPALALRAE